MERIKYYDKDKLNSLSLSPLVVYGYGLHMVCRCRSGLAGLADWHSAYDMCTGIKGVPGCQLANILPPGQRHEGARVEFLEK